jgi:hypothetical protein
MHADALLELRGVPPNKPLKQTAAPSRDGTASLEPVKYLGLARRYLRPPGFLMRALLNAGTLGWRDNEHFANWAGRRFRVAGQR